MGIKRLICMARWRSPIARHVDVRLLARCAWSLARAERRFGRGCDHANRGHGIDRRSNLCCFLLSRTLSAMPCRMNPEPLWNMGSEHVSFREFHLGTFVCTCSVDRLRLQHHAQGRNDTGRMVARTSGCFHAGGGESARTGTMGAMRRRRGLMATDAEWERISRAAGAFGRFRDTSCPASWRRTTCRRRSSAARCALRSCSRSWRSGAFARPAPARRVSVFTQIDGHWPVTLAFGSIREGCLEWKAAARAT